MEILAATRDGWDGPPFPFFIFPLIWLLLIAGLLAFGVFGRRRYYRAQAGRSGERVLAERYANGDIDDVEYRTRLATLKELGRG
jgi:putative membrane protein